MPKYYQDKICGYYLYFTSFCTVECMHVHASDRKLTEEGSAKFFVKDDGNTVLQKRGILNDREISKIQEYIKRHYKEMYIKWAEYSRNGFYKGIKIISHQRGREPTEQPLKKVHQHKFRRHLQRWRLTKECR